MKAEVVLGAAPDCFVALPIALASSLHSQTNRFPSPVALKLKWLDESTGRSKTAFVSWSGSASSKRSCMEIGREFALNIGLATTTDSSSSGNSTQVTKYVEITPVNPKDATTIQIEPVSEDDWEIMELNAGYLEEQIRNQIAVIYDQEHFPLHIHQRTVLHLRVVGVDPQGAECLRLNDGVEFIVTPKPRKQNIDNNDTEEEPEITLQSCLLRVQPQRNLLQSTTDNTAFIHPETMKTLGWKSGYIISITALQKPFSFELLDQQLQQNGKGNENAASSTKKPRTGHCYMQCSPHVEERHIILPLQIRLQCLIEERTRVLVRYVASGTRKFTKVLPKKIHISQIRWMPHGSLSTGDVNWPGNTTLSPKKVTDGFYKLLKEQQDSFWESERFVCFPVTEKDGVTEKLQTFSVTIETTSPLKCFYLKSEEISKRKDILEVSPRQSLPLPNHCNPTGEQVSKPPKKVLGGLDKDLGDLRAFLSAVLMKKEYKDKLFFTPIPPMAIISGKHGSGKTAIAQTIIRELEEPPLLIYHHCVQFELLLHRSIHTLQRYITEVVQLARLNQPAVIILENIDAVVTTDQQGEYSILAEQLSEFLADVMSQIAQEAHQIAFIMTTTNISATHKTLRASHIANLQIELQAPTQQQRIEILSALTKHKHVFADTEQLQLLSKRCEGYLPADLEQLLDRAIHQCSFRSLGVSHDVLDDIPSNSMWTLTFEDFQKAQESYTPASLKGIKFVKSDKTWNDVGALDDVKQLLKETFEWPTKYEKLFEKCPLKLRRGLLLYGPPGCGKTLIASAVAQECNLNFISVKGPELLNKYIGASEQAVRDLFEQAAAAKPCILFFDEFDSIAPRRGHDNTGVTDRVVNQLLTQLDGVESISSVYVLAATSRPDLIDPALLRPGRLDKCLYCGIPSKEDRVKILHSVSSKVQLSPDVSFEEVAAMTEGYTGADLHALLHNAQLEVVHQIIDSQKESLQISSQSHSLEEYKKNLRIIELGQSKMNKAERAQLVRKVSQFANLENGISKGQSAKEKPTILVTQQHIQNAFEELRPSVTSSEKQRYEAIYADFLSSRGAGAKPGSGLQKATQA